MSMPFVGESPCFSLNIRAVSDPELGVSLVLAPGGAPLSLGEKVLRVMGVADSAVILRPVSSGLRGRCSGNSLLAEWEGQGKEQIELLQSGGPRGGQISGWHRRHTGSGWRQSETQVDLTVSGDQVQGRIGRPHPHSGKDVMVGGTLPPLLSALAGCLAYRLLVHREESSA
ncbi:hypothetical protein ACFP81_04875 [Deinococcus lacus]|uniref:Uncharacterized protein n=1 Tax=Deinococcus lacus TaxID=392561 RepID=A0ABW1YDB6_9DEIO